MGFRFPSLGGKVGGKLPPTTKGSRESLQPYKKRRL